MTDIQWMLDAMDDISVGDNDLYAQIADAIRQQQGRIEELEKRVRNDALEYLSDTGRLLDDLVEADKASDEWAEIAMGMGKKFNEANARVQELEAKLTRATAALRKVHGWFDELEMYTAPDYHLAPALQEVKDTLKEIDA